MVRLARFNTINFDSSLFSAGCNAIFFESNSNLNFDNFISSYFFV